MKTLNRLLKLCIFPVMMFFFFGCSVPAKIYKTPRISGHIDNRTSLPMASLWWKSCADVEFENPFSFNLFRSSDKDIYWYSRSISHINHRGNFIIPTKILLSPHNGELERSLFFYLSTPSFLSPSQLDTIRMDLDYSFFDVVGRKNCHLMLTKRNLVFSGGLKTLAILDSLDSLLPPAYYRLFYFKYRCDINCGGNSLPDCSDSWFSLCYSSENIHKEDLQCGTHAIFPVYILFPENRYSFRECFSLYIDAYSRSGGSELIPIIQLDTIVNVENISDPFRLNLSRDIDWAKAKLAIEQNYLAKVMDEAVRKGDSAVCSKILSMKKLPVDSLGFWYLIYTGTPSIVKMLLDAGVDPSQKDKNAESILKKVAWNIKYHFPNNDSTANAKIFELLLEHGGHDESAVYFLSSSHNRRLLKLALAKGMKGNVVVKDGTSTCTALIDAIESGDTASLKMLIDAKADVNFGTKEDTPLISAIKEKNCTFVEMLLNAGADPYLCLPGTRMLPEEFNYDSIACITELLQHIRGK